MRLIRLIPILAGVTLACAPATKLITRPAAQDPIASSKDDAVLLVSNVMKWPVLNLLDQNGEVVGQLTGRSFTTIHRPAGPFKLYVAVENRGNMGDRIEGNLVAGKVYYVQIGMRWGGASMFAVAQRLDAKEWANRNENERNLDRVTFDPAGVPQLKQELGNVGAILKDVDSAFAHFDAAEQANRKIEPNDGEKR